MKSTNTWWRKLLSDYGMVLVLLLLCVFFSIVTLAEQPLPGAEAAGQVADRLRQRHGEGSDRPVLVVARLAGEDDAFVETLTRKLSAARYANVTVVRGDPTAARRALAATASSGQKAVSIAGTQVTGRWDVFKEFGRPGAEDIAHLTDQEVLKPTGPTWPNFRKIDNLRNIPNQIVVIAILAIGMTLVIITGGIDLSVGSLIALAAVSSTLLISRLAGAAEASGGGMLLCALAAMALCAAMGLFSGSMVALFDIPPFIATLGMMLIASGVAYIFSQSASIYELPGSFTWLGQGTDLIGLPNAVVLAALLYVGAHVFMSQTRWGRYIYAVGGNAEAARLSGVPVLRVKLFVYAVSGALAGLGGVVTASQLKSGSPKFGLMYELYTIAAVVVGGTSLAGGEGKVLGTLIGALIIAVIGNGMNLCDITFDYQKVILGAVILGAVLLDKLKRRDWSFLRRAKAGH